MKKNKKRQLGGVLTLVIIAGIVIILSFLLSRFGIVVSKTVISNNMLESSPINVNNALSKDGLGFIVGNFTSNLKYFEPLALLIVALISTSIIESSGIIKKIAAIFKKTTDFKLTAVVVFLTLITVFLGNYSFLLLMPIVALIYKELRRSPILGLMTVFLAATIGFGTGIFVNYNDYILGFMTQSSARVEIDASYTFGLYSYAYLKIAATLMITAMLTYLIETRLAKKLPIHCDEVEEIEILENEKKALLFSFAFFVLYMIFIVISLIPGNPFSDWLLNSSESVYVAKLFSPGSPFNEGSFLFILLGFAVTGYIYGTLTKKFKDSKDFSSGFSKHFEGIGEVFVLIFFFSQIIALIDWTNIGRVFAYYILELIVKLNFSGAPLLVLMFIATIIIGLVIPSTIEKWEIMSPLSVPLFMKANFTPEFSQIVFRAADGISKSLTPLFPYYIILLGFVKKHNNEKPITLFGALRLMLPIILIMVLFWVLILLSFYIIGIPIGPNSLATL